MAKAGPYPSETTRSPASGARTIWERTAAVQIPLFAATNASFFTSAGRTEEAAGLKKTAPTDMPNATVYTPTGASCHTARTTARTDRNRSEPTITGTRGHRSTNGPANGAIRSTGRISATTTPLTPSPDPVRS